MAARRRLLPARLGWFVLVVFLVGGCGGSGGDDDAGGSEPPPPPTDDLVAPSQSSSLDFTIDRVTIASPPVVEFTVTNENGHGVLLTDEDLGGLRFTIAKLVPGSNGDADQWQNYINRVEQATPDVGPGGAAALETALQATTENGGTLTTLGGGSYRYTFATDITDPEQTHGVDHDASLTHRLAMQVELTGAGDSELIANPWTDFVPDGTPLTTTKRVATVESCNECHDKLAMHGGGRVEVEYCAVCHNPGTSDANSGNVLDLAVMVHKLHAGAQLSNLPYTIWGYRDSVHDYSTVGYPQDLRNCTKCHSGADPQTPDGENWKTRPTMQSCGACHDAVDFSNHPAEGIAQEDNSQCGVCHVPYSSTLNRAVENAHTIPTRVASQRFAFNIAEVNYDADTRQVAVRFSVTDPTAGDQAYDIHRNAPFDGGSVTVLVGWDADDFHNTGSGETPALPISINALSEANAAENADGTFTVTTTLPAEAGGTGIAALTGRVAVDGTRVPVTNVFEYFAIDGTLQPRREVVALAKCNECHGDLSMHGGNRQGSVEVCSVCHNPNATDFNRRPASLADDGDSPYSDFAAVGIDGKREESIHLKYMIHAIHAGEAGDHGFREEGIVVYGYGRRSHDFGHMRYPGTLSNCRQCHVDETYQLPVPSATLATTVQTAGVALAGANRTAQDAALADPADDLNISSEAAACLSCHDGESARTHMQQVGQAVFDQTQPVIDASVVEICSGCHGPGEYKDVAAVHAVHPEP